MSSPEADPLSRHVPVLPVEVLQLLDPQPGEVFVDATVGAGGHTRLLAQRVGAAGRVIGLDCDGAMLEAARPRLAGLPVTLIQANFDGLREVLDGLGLAAVDGVLADLGVCSDQLDVAQRGFSFARSGPLDMRLDPDQGEPAAALLRRLNERDLADLFWRLGEERFSRRIARRIVEERRSRPIETTEQLADLVRRCVPRPPRGRRRRAPIDPATRVFQALRIAVNDELGALDRLLAALPGCVRPGGRAAVIGFHSLEDRAVKQAFRDKTTWESLTRKPVQAGEAEVASNPRARSAKLRAARRAGRRDPLSRRRARMMNNRKTRLAWLLTCGLLGLLGAAAAFKAYDGNKAVADTADPTKGVGAAAPAPMAVDAPATKATAGDPPPPAPPTGTAVPPQMKPAPTDGVPAPDASAIKPVAAKESAASEKCDVVPAGGVMPQAPPETSEPRLILIPTSASVPAPSAPSAAPPSVPPPAPETKDLAPPPTAKAYPPPAAPPSHPADQPISPPPAPSEAPQAVVPVKAEGPAPAVHAAEMEIKPLPNLRSQPPAEQPKTVLPLTGTYQVNLDGRGGFVLPAAVREQLGNCDTVMVSPGTDACLWLTNQAHLRRLCQRLDQSPAREVDVRTFKRLYYAQTTRASVGPDGRVAIGERLARFAGLSQEVVLVGIDDHFEVWDLGRWRQYTQEKGAKAAANN